MRAEGVTFLDRCNTNVVQPALVDLQESIAEQMACIDEHIARIDDLEPGEPAAVEPPGSEHDTVIENGMSFARPGSSGGGQHADLVDRAEVGGVVEGHDVAVYHRRGEATDQVTTTGVDVGGGGGDTTVGRLGDGDLEKPAPSLLTSSSSELVCSPSPTAARTVGSTISVWSRWTKVRPSQRFIVFQPSNVAGW